MHKHIYLNNIKISLTNPQQVVNAIIEYSYKESNYICLFGLYPLVQSERDNNLQQALNNSWLNPIHGKFIEFYLKIKGYKNIKTVDGVYLLKELLNENISHYFYGANSEVLKKIKDRIKMEYPNARVAGYKAPPLVKINSIKNNTTIEKDMVEINALKPNIVWVGVGGIKQDLMMNNYYQQLDNSILIGVGAVFDYFAGNIPLSPEFVKRLGLRWLYRMFFQPNMFKRDIKVIKAGFRFLLKTLFQRKTNRN